MIGLGSDKNTQYKKHVLCLNIFRGIILALSEYKFLYNQCFVDPPQLLVANPISAEESRQYANLPKTIWNNLSSVCTVLKKYLKEILLVSFCIWRILLMSPKSIGAMKLQLCQTLLLSLGKSLCNPKVVWEKEQCWLTCQNSLFLFPDFFPLCGAQTHQRQDYLLMFWSHSKTIRLVKSFQLASWTP